MIPALRDGIETLLQTVTGVNADNEYYLQEDLKAEYPYVVWQGIDSEFDLDAKNKHEPQRVQFTFRGIDEDGMGTVIEAFKLVFDQGNGSITVAGYDVIDIRRLLSVPTQVFNKIFQRSIDYKFYLIKAR